MKGFYVLLKAQMKHCRRMSWGCSEGQGCIEELWILFAGVGGWGSALQAVSTSRVLHTGGHVGTGLASRSPHHKLGRGLGWQHDRGRRTGGHGEHVPAEHGERQRAKRGSMHQPLWSSSRSESLCPAKLAGKLLIAKNHTEHRATLFLSEKLSACYLTPLFFHQPT